MQKTVLITRYFRLADWLRIMTLYFYRGQFANLCICGTSEIGCRAICRLQRENLELLGDCCERVCAVDLVLWEVWEGRYNNHERDNRNLSPHQMWHDCNSRPGRSNWIVTESLSPILTLPTLKVGASILPLLNIILLQPAEQLLYSSVCIQLIKGPCRVVLYLQILCQTSLRTCRNIYYDQ